MLTPVEGHQTTLEWATDLLRDYLWKGEEVIGFIKQNFYRDAFLTTSEVVAGRFDCGDGS